MTQILPRAEAEAALAKATAAPSLYGGLRPAFTRLDPLLDLLRRRGFSGLLRLAGEEEDGAVWVEEGAPHSAWLLSMSLKDAPAEEHKPLELLRHFWSEPEVLLTIHPGPVPSLTPDAVSELPAPEPVPGPPPAPEVVFDDTPLRAPSAVAAQAPLVPGPEVAAVPLIPGPEVAAVPWDRLLPLALARIRRNRGGPLADRLQESMNEVLSPSAIIDRGEVHGTVSAESGTTAVRVLAASLSRVAGSAFALRLLNRLAEELGVGTTVRALLTDPEER